MSTRLDLDRLLSCIGDLSCAEQATLDSIHIKTENLEEEQAKDRFYKRNVAAEHAAKEAVVVEILKSFKELKRTK